MKIGKRSLALLLGSILLLSTLIPCTMFFSAAAEEPVSVYASDLQRLITKAETGWSGYPVTYDKDPGGGSVGIAAGGNAVTYEKGITAHAPAQFDFNVEGLHVTRFTAYVGMEDDLKTDGYKDQADTTFYVKADGVSLENGTSPYTTYESEPYFLDVAIPEGTKTVTLSCDVGNHTYSDHIAWADAKFYFSSVEGLTITGLALEQDAVSLEVDKTATVGKTVTGDPIISRYVYTTADPSVATVDESGKLTALKPGKTTVTLTETYSGLSASADVTVTKEAGKAYRNYNAWLPYNTKEADPIAYSSENPNEVTMQLLTGEVRENGFPQMLLTKAPAGDFSVTVKVSGGLTANFQSVGLVVHGGNGVAVALERRHHSYFDGTNVFCSTIPTTIVEGADTSADYVECHTPEMQKDAEAYLRLDKVGNEFKCYYSYEGTEGTWTEITPAPVSEKLATAADLKVGIITRSGIYDAKIPVTFKDFTLNGEALPFSVTDETDTLLELYAPDALTLVQTGMPKLPGTVRGLLSSGAEADIPVTWDTESFDSAAVGSATLVGRPSAESGYADSGLSVTLSVTVTERTSYDLSGDGLLNVKDISRLLLILGDPEAALDGDPDMNFDGRVSIEDVTVLLQMLSEG